jgi:branched-subunit amino acid transport protein
VAIFTALALHPLLASVGAHPQLVAGAPLAAALVGALIAWRTGSVVLTIGAGLAAFWALRLVGLV